MMVAILAFPSLWEVVRVPVVMPNQILDLVESRVGADQLLYIPIILPSVILAAHITCCLYKTILFIVNFQVRLVVGVVCCVNLEPELAIVLIHSLIEQEHQIDLLHLHEYCEGMWVSL